MIANNKIFKVAVAGNPNCGKSTLINGIAGSRLKVGNWSGVTVEKKEATIKYKGININFVDLPGIYNLAPYTEDEIVARDYLVYEKPDLVLNVLDSTNLERNLNLTVQLKELGIPMLLALNFQDEAEKKGINIDTAKIEKLLGVKVVSTVASKKQGLHQIFEYIMSVQSGQANIIAKDLYYGVDIEDSIVDITGYLNSENSSLNESFPLRWLSLRLMEKDSHLLEKESLQEYLPYIDNAVKHLKKDHDDSIENILAQEVYAQAAGLTKEVVTLSKKPFEDITEKIDKFALNNIFGLPLFAIIMWFTFKFTFDFGTPFVDWLDSVINGPIIKWSHAFLTSLDSPSWLISLVNDGIISGVGSVLVFVPIIFFMMLFITFLESTGYMARAAFIMDKYMHKIGLHGKSFIPFLLGFGCNVPSIFATRTLETKRDRILTSLLVPLMSCGARLPVYVLFTAAFFPVHGGIIIWILYLLGVLLAFLMGILFQKFLFKAESPHFIMELPPYRMPSFRNLVVHTWEKVKHFVIKAGTYILAMSVVVWVLLHFPLDSQSKKDSYLGKAGEFISPVFKPLGFGDWESGAALISGIIAKEVVVSSMGEIYSQDVKKEPEIKPLDIKADLKEIVFSFGGTIKTAFSNVFSTFTFSSLSTEEDAEAASVKSEVLKRFSPLSALSFMIFVLLYVPCLVVLAAMRFEFGTWKWSFFSIGYQFILAWIVAFIVYQMGSLFGF